MILATMLALAAMAGAETQDAPPPRPEPAPRALPWPPVRPPAPPGRLKVLQPIEPGSWVTNDDYPAAALRGEMEGTVTFRLMVDANGQVTGCTVLLTSGWPLLDTTACALLRQRARFVPAEDARGRRIPATYQNRFRWEIPRETAPFTSWAMTYRFHLSATGEISECFAELADGRRLSNACQPIWDMPESARSSLRGQAANGVAVEARAWQQIDGSPSTPPFAEAAGARTVFYRRTHFTVDEGGKVTRCDILEERGTDVMELTRHACHPGYDFPDAGQVDPAHRGATMSVSATVRPL